MWIGVTQPTKAAWTGGARWYRCEVLVSSSVEDDGGLVQRVGSLKDALDEPKSPLLLTCYAVQLDKDGKIGTMPAASCARPAQRRVRRVLGGRGDFDYPETSKEWDAFHDGCRELIASYVEVPDDADLQYPRRGGLAAGRRGRLGAGRPGRALLPVAGHRHPDGRR